MTGLQKKRKRGPERAREGGRDRDETDAKRKTARLLI